VAGYQSYLNLRDGSYRFCIKAIDGTIVGNATVTEFTLDRVRPAATITWSESPTRNLQASFAVDDGVVGSGVAETHCRLSPVHDWVNCTSPLAYVDITGMACLPRDAASVSIVASGCLESGAYDLFVRAIDRAGNVGDATEPTRIVVDVLPPTVTLTGVELPLTNGRAAGEDPDHVRVWG
jgi:hypothetical protein